MRPSIVNTRASSAQMKTPNPSVNQPKKSPAIDSRAASHMLINQRLLFKRFLIGTSDLLRRLMKPPINPIGISQKKGLFKPLP